MTKRQNPGKGWRGDRWSPVIGHAIDRRLRKRRNRIAELLAIDLDEQEWRNNPVDFPDDPDMSREARFMKWRETPPTSGSLVYRIDLAIEEITGELRRCWGLLRDVNCARSSAQVYRRLEHIVDHADDVVELFEESDPESKAIIEDHYPGGWLSLESSESDRQKLLDAVRAAKATLPPPTRGRPAGTSDFASEKLASALADIYRRHSGDTPARRVAQDRGSGRLEYGPFKDFVEQIVSVIPDRLRRSGKGGLKGIDYLVRRGVESKSD